MSAIVTRLFDSYDQASKAIAELEAEGVPHASMSLVANNREDRYSDAIPPDTSGAIPGGATGASLGSVIGGGAGLLAGLGMLAIPGVGPVVAAGWLIATLVGAGVGAAGGGLLGSLVGAGISETDAHLLAEGVRRGGTLVTVKADDTQVAGVERTLDRFNAVDQASRAEAYRAEGWSRFDETAPAYMADRPGDIGPR